jgi:iron complex outermembrane receptor protein
MRAPVPLLAAGLTAWLVLSVSAARVQAADMPQAVDPADLKNLSIEELMQLDVTSVSRRSERLSQAAAAIAVVTPEDLRRSGVTNLPDALRLVNSLFVGRSSQRDWAITARGFAITTSNKLLVLIDGRSIYTPLFSGTFWDVQDTLLEDVDRIEVIRGPGATLWGANAVNGIINIITKRAVETQGGLAVAGAGHPVERGFGALRYGGTAGESGHYRVYGKAFDRGPLERAGGASAGDPMRMGQGGFRADWGEGKADAFTVQGDAYDGRIGEAIRDDTRVDGGNLLSRWSHHVAPGSDVDVQLYWDRTHRLIPQTFEEHRDTFDLDLQNHLRAGERHDIVWGFGLRRTQDQVVNSAAVAFVPSRQSQDLYSLFAQDEIGLRDDLHLTAGTKLEHNSYTGFELQPNLRLTWVLNERRTLWGAVSRAVRTPTRLDENIEFLSAGQVVLTGSTGFVSEKLVSYELGYREQLRPEASIDLSTFYNVYRDLRSQDFSPGGTLPIVLANNLEAETWGAELRGNFQPCPWWQLHAAYAYFDKQLSIRPGGSDRFAGLEEGNDTHNRFTLRSLIDLPGRVELDAWLRWVDDLPSPLVHPYQELDLHLGWHASPSLQLALVGQNLLHARHQEFAAIGAPGEQIQRSFYGKATWSF